MDIDFIKLILETTVLPCIGLISALIVTMFGAWMTFQFSKSLENYRRELASETPKTNVGSNTKKSENDNKANEDDDDDSFFDWIATVMFRGTTALANLIAFAVGTFILFVIILPYGTTFIHNRITELINIPFFYQLYSEISQFFSVGILALLFLLAISTIGGFLAMFLTTIIFDVVAWIFDVESSN